jgi:hypothetical protein
MFAGRIAGTIGLDHFARALALHDVADAHRLGIGFPVVHAAAHVGIKREIEHPQQQAAWRQRRHPHFLEAEILGRRRPLRPGREDDLPDSGLTHDGS